ncbi:uncharacterized protein LOC143859721 [Tasmannia lanceolata]|uniref:uncharacterized protein LOC143859721 n=1 Tax=Tasmannia lanceolata TaxID=3420 RepID=UPI004063A8C2
MGGSTLTVFSLCILHFFLLSGCFRASYSLTLPDPITAALCAVVNCGEGTCQASSNGSNLPIDCECKQGWKQIEIGSFTLPPCVLPNCTIDFDCGSASPPPPPSPIPLLPPVNLSDPCNYTFCGDGICAKTTAFPFFSCNCKEGSANLLNLTSMACMKQCYFGVDCHNLGFGLGAPPPPVSSNGSNSGSNSNQAGSREGSNSSRHNVVLVIVLFLAIFIPWI